MSPKTSGSTIRSLEARLRALESCHATVPSEQIDTAALREEDLVRLTAIEQKIAAGAAIESLSDDELRFVVSLPRSTEIAS